MGAIEDAVSWVLHDLAARELVPVDDGPARRNPGGEWRRCVIVESEHARALILELDRLRALEALNVGAIDASLVRLGAVTGAIGPMPADPLAALEAAEVRLLESARWTPGDRGFWIDPDDGTQWPRAGAISDVRRRLAAKGCA